MPHLLLHHPHLHHAPLTPHHHHRSPLPRPPSTTSILQRRSLTGKPHPLCGVVLRPPTPQLNRNARVVKCMANPRRVQMVGKQILRELSDMLLTDKVIQSAVLPEAALGADRYISSLTTISDVEVSSDLQVVKVYVSVFGDERGKKVAISGLKSKVKYVRSALARRMKLRLTPEIRFIEDDSIERGSRVIEILDKLKKERMNAEGQDDDQYDSDLPDDDSDWDDDDPEDEGIIYVK
ncbi:probable ribosome-binding factor A, chloroplastic [Rhododendron vialii]|uniref:probable ribosome-binding factor A, chloroplastic n=1 Tax=Rhododendron vialii TaxID=182163 RepID=UPI00265EA44C|nr:probable ribosome-binding factor A, chloroplastic [Rhododendron vialii]